VQELECLKREGLSISAISELTGYDRKTVRKYLLDPDGVPGYVRESAKAGKLDAFKAYLGERMQAGVWKLRERGYRGGYTILTDWLRPQRLSARVVAVRRFETPPGRQAQVDWGHLGSIEISGREYKLWGFTLTLGYSRMLMAEAALDQKLGTLLRMHEEGFRQLGGAQRDVRVPEEILYDRMKTVWLETDERGETVWHLRALLGIHTKVVPAVPGADERQDRIGREVATKLPVRAAGPRAVVSGGLQRRTASVGLDSGQSAGARNDARTGEPPLGYRTVQFAAH
jgi:transposase